MVQFVIPVSLLKLRRTEVGLSLAGPSVDVASSSPFSVGSRLELKSPPSSVDQIFFPSIDSVSTLAPSAPIKTRVLSDERAIPASTAAYAQHFEIDISGAVFAWPKAPRAEAVRINNNISEIFGRKQRRITKSNSLGSCEIPILAHALCRVILMLFVKEKLPKNYTKEEPQCHLIR